MTRLIDSATITDFSKRAKYARRLAGLSQKEMADKMGINPLTYGALERGTSQATISHLYAICDVLKVSADYLLGLSDETRGSDGLKQKAEAMEREVARQRSTLKMIAELALNQA